MIKARIDTLIPVYNKLFNSILTPGTMPDRLGVKKCSILILCPSLLTKRPPLFRIP